jgi:hypothetical protein
MKYAWKICFGLIGFLLSATVFCQSPSPQIAYIKKYKASIDSLHALYIIVQKSLDVDSMRMAGELGMGEGIAEGVYPYGVNDSKVEGGFSVYTFSKKDTTYRLYYEGGRNDAYVTKTFYYKNDTLLYGEMTVRRWDNLVKKPYTVQEYYWHNKRIASNTMNEFPSIREKSLIPVSLFKEGMEYYELYRYKPLTK